MTTAQADKAISLARRFGCWPDDTEVIEGAGGAFVDVIIGVSKGRPKAFRIDEEGEVSRAPDA